MAGLALAAVAAAALAALALRPSLRRWRMRRRLEAAATEVAEAMAGGRLTRETGEALLQHLEGLRRSVAAAGRG